MDNIKEWKDKLKQIIKRDAYFKEKITLSSGKTSDYYIDARRVTLNAEGAYLCAKIIFEMVKNEKIHALGGPTMGADPLVGAIAFLSYQEKKPINTFIVRKIPKAHGKQQQIEGPLLPPQGRVILVDDVATTGQAFVQSIDVLKKIDVVVPKAICIVDRAEGGKEALAKLGCELISIFNISEIHQS